MAANMSIVDEFSNVYPHNIFTSIIILVIGIFLLMSSNIWKKHSRVRVYGISLWVVIMSYALAVTNIYMFTAIYYFHKTIWFLIAIAMALSFIGIFLITFARKIYRSVGREITETAVRYVVSAGVVTTNS